MFKSALAFFALAATFSFAADPPTSWKFDTSVGKPSIFSTPLPEGNYEVTVTLGDPHEASVTTVEAESRRLMLESVSIAPGQLEKRTFVVNVRNSKLPPPPPNAPGGSEVRLNPREAGVLHWDDKLTLEFSGPRPAVAALEITKVDVPTVFLVGDSTVTDQPRAPITSWGQMLTAFFKPGVAIANHAESGETLKSFITGLRLDKILSQMKKGDYLFIQFGHNDQKANWPQTYVEPFTTHKAYLRVFIAEARRRGAIPVLVTPMQRLQFDDCGKVKNSLGDFSDSVRQTAKEENVPLIDLNAMSVAFYEAVGAGNSKLISRDGTHHTAYGAYELAKCIVEGIKANKLDLASYIVDDFKPFDPARPDAPQAFSALPAIFVAGDSTANNGDRLGWGDPFADYFNPAKVTVLNHARAGRSSRTFVTEGLWDKLLGAMKAGDFVLIQFGHNDGGPLDTGRARGSLPGLGDQTQEVTMPDGTKQVVHTFGWYMRKMVADTKARGATPILLSLTVRNIWTDGKVERGVGDYGKWAAQIAQSQGVAFLDLTTLIADRYEQMGQEKVKELFPKDHTHTSQEGASLNASLVVEGLKRIESPLETYLAPPTLWLIGDSTVRNGRGDGAGGQWGWGEPLVDLFDPAKISVVNRAVGGLSSRTYFSQGQWARVLAEIKPGDFVMMQFGHNDNGPINDNFRARGTIKGVGEETEEIDNLLTKQHEIVHSYGWYLRKFVADTRAKGATPIICSLIPRGNWKDGKLIRNAEDYGKWAAEVAQAEKATFVDLNEIIARECDELGPEEVAPLFAADHLHTTRAGAELNAAAVITGLKANQPNPLAAFLK